MVQSAHINHHLSMPLVRSTRHRHSYDISARSASTHDAAALACTRRFSLKVQRPIQPFEFCVLMVSSRWIAFSRLDLPRTSKDSELDRNGFVTAVTANYLTKLAGCRLGVMGIHISRAQHDLYSRILSCEQHCEWPSRSDS